MGMKLWRMRFSMGVITVVLTTVIFAGCGKNVVGPSAPDALTQQTLQSKSNVEGDALEVVAELEDGTSETQCHDKKWTRSRYHHYLRKFHLGFIQWVGVKIVDTWFNDAELTQAYRQITKSRLFYIVTFNCGVGPVLFLESLKILAETWYPGLGSSPKNCDPEITLLPYRWSVWKGFYGERLPGWGNGNGYHIESLTSDLDNVILQTSGVGENGNNLYMNQAIHEFKWQYFYYPYTPSADNVPKEIRVRLVNEYWADRFKVYDETYISVNNERVVAEDVWFSTVDKSAVCKVVSHGTDLLNIDMSFDATGAGGGTVDVKNLLGGINHYEFVVYNNGHGYYKKNGSRRLRF